MASTRDVAGLLRQTARDWWEDRCPRLAAALSFYVLFALAPLLLVAIAVAGLVLGHSAAEAAIVRQVDTVFGGGAGRDVQGLMDQAATGRGGRFGAAVATGALLLGASGVFVQLQDALDTVWEVRLAPHVPLVAKVRKRLRAFTMVVGIGFLLVVSLVASTVLSAASAQGRGLPGFDVLWLVVDLAVSVLAIGLLFALMFKEVPDAVVRWRDAWVGGLATSCLFTLGKLVLGTYLGRSTRASSFGNAAAWAAILLWVYYCAQLVLFGAEFTQAYATRRGRAIEPKPGARHVVEQATVQPTARAP